VLKQLTHFNAYTCFKFCHLITEISSVVLNIRQNIRYKIYIIESDATLNFIKLYYIVIAATCFGPIYRIIFRLIFRQVECTVLVIRDYEIS